MDASLFHLQSHVDTLYTQKPRQFAFQAQSKEEFDTWRIQARRHLQTLLGLASRQLPGIVSATRISIIDRGQYLEEKLILQVGEGIHAPIYLLIPKTRPPYIPVLAFHGHDPNVQYIMGNYPDSETEQAQLSQDANYAQALARAGYLVCAVEQRGFGERISDQYNAALQTACRHLSFEYLLQGRTMIGERCWDGMMALTFLKNRDDCVPEVVGCTGHSGGGTTALWLSALDDRITVCVPSCCFSTFKGSILSTHHCECNYIPHILEYGEMGDLAALIAPRPLRLIAGEQDPIFPIKGAEEQFQILKQAYQLLDASSHCSLAVHPGGHSYHQEYSQEWFRQWLI